jgi:hypothetical protein
MRLKQTFFYSAALLVSLTGCGGGGGGGGETAGGGGSTATNVATMAGAVIDGYIVGATVCLDLNNNYACDVTEPSAVSGVDGAYTFEVTVDIPAGTQILADIPVGAVDQDLGPITKAYNMLAPHDNPEVVTPLTTLVSQEIVSSGGKITAEQAELSVKLALGIDSDTDLLGNDFISVVDEDLQDTAEVLAEALAATKATLESSEGASTLSAAEVTKAAIATVKNVIAAELIVGGKAARTLDEVEGYVTQTVQGQVQNIVAATKSGDGEVVNLVEILKSGDLIILSEGKERPAGFEDWVEGLTMEFVYFPGAEEGEIIDLTSAEGDMVAFLPDSEDDVWIPIEYGEHYVLGADGDWVLPSENSGSGTKLEGNCAIFYDDGINASREFCFVQKDVSDKPIGDFIPGICDDDGGTIVGCNPEAVPPAGSYVYDFVLTVPENEFDGNYSIYFENLVDDAGLFDGWYGYVDPVNDDFEVSIEGFIAKYRTTSGSVTSNGTPDFRVKSYDPDAKEGVFEWMLEGGDTSISEDAPFSVLTVGGNEIIRSPSPRLLRANNPDENEPFQIFAKVLNGGGDYGIYKGDFVPSGTKLSVPFNGSLDYSIFASKVLVDFVFEQTGTPAFPYDDFFAAE